MKVSSRRTEIQRAGYDVMGIQGLEALNARTVAGELQINHATVHYYFPQRIDLLVGIADFALEQFRRDREKLQEGARTNTERFEAELALAEAYCKKTSRFVKVFAGLYVASVAHPELRKKLQLLWKEWVSVAETVTSSAKLRKETPYKNAELLVTTLFGIAMASHMLDGKLGGKALIDEIYESAIN
jgi:AcrR family transcriptional regulator